MKLKTMIITLGIGALTVTASIGAEEAVSDTQVVGELPVIASIGADKAVSSDTQEVSKDQKSKCTYSEKDCPKTKACPHTDKAKCESVKKKGCCPAKSAE